MKQVTQMIVPRYFKPSKKRKTVYFSAEQVKKEWLPSIRNIRFAVVKQKNLTATGRRAYFFRYGYSDLGVTFFFGYGDGDCKAKGDLWSVTAENSHVKLLRASTNWSIVCNETSYVR